MQKFIYVNICVIHWFMCVVVPQYFCSPKDSKPQEFDCLIQVDVINMYCRDLESQISLQYLYLFMSVFFLTLCVCVYVYVCVCGCVSLQMSSKRSNSFRRAILQGSRQLKGATLREEVGLGLSQRLVRHIAYETLPREVDRKWYFDSYTCCPPPWLILVITLVEVCRLSGKV